MEYLQEKSKRDIQLILTFCILKVLSNCNNGVLCANQNGLLRGRELFLVIPASSPSSNSIDTGTEMKESNNLNEQSNDSTIENVLKQIVNETTLSQLLSLDYDMESETNKTKRSKASFRWLKNTLGLGSSQSDSGSQPEGEMMEQNIAEENAEASMETSVSNTETNSTNGILSKLNPFNIKGKVSSKVSTVTNAAGQVYQTIAGKVGLGGSTGSGDNGDGTSDTDMNDDNNPSSSGVRDTNDDDSSSAAYSTVQSSVLGLTLLCVSYLGAI